MTRIPIIKGWRLYIIEANEESPMEDHGRMELAADDKNKRIFAYDIMVITYGLKSVKCACNKYIRSLVQFFINRGEFE
jgi:hypothetical protein